MTKRPEEEDDEFFGFNVDPRRNHDDDVDADSGLTAYDFAPIEPIDARRYIGSMLWSPAQVSELRPPSWKLPGSNIFPWTAREADTAFGDRNDPRVERPASAPIGPPVSWRIDRAMDAPTATALNLKSDQADTAPFKRPAESPAAPILPTLAARAAVNLPSLNRPDTQPGLMQQAVDALARWVGSFFLPGHGSSVANDGGIASADAHRPMQGAERSLKVKRSQESVVEPERRAASERTGSASGEKSSLEHTIQSERESEAGATFRAIDSPPHDQDVLLETVQHRNDSRPDSARRPPKDEAERKARNEAFRQEAYDRTKDLKPEDWQERFDVIVEMSKRHGFLPELVRTHLWSVFRSTRSTDERLDAARTIATLLSLFPGEAERHINGGERALIDEVIRLDDEGKVDPDRIFEQAARNVRYPDFLTYLGAAIGAIGGRRGRRDGRVPHMVDREGTRRFLWELNKAARGTRFEIRLQQSEIGFPRRMDVHVVDPRTNHEIILRYEIKTGSGKKSANQIYVDRILGNVNDVGVDLFQDRIRINDQDFKVHFRAVRRALRERQRDVGR